ncbi:unnamed protein product [Prorocentrum cordatum]|uniref:Uncharacterized protein n=1 Tax=Prorocentrum cordatum TaxID=2364126 RepID=A0ABN9TDF6_9DINO|nr:unnamed protein product [Polarella glacialis]
MRGSAGARQSCSAASGARRARGSCHELPSGEQVGHDAELLEDTALAVAPRVDRSYAQVEDIVH